MEQPKKPGASRDIADLKARLGLKNPGGAPAPVPAAPPGRPPFGPGGPGGVVSGAPAAAPRQAPTPNSGIPAPVPAPVPQAAALPNHDPYAAMRPPVGRQFDLRPVDDGVPVASVRAKGGRSLVVTGILMLAIGGAVGAGFGGAAVGRRAFNSTNAAAKRVKIDLEDMNKTLSQITTSLTASQQRLAAAKQDFSSYDPRLVADLERIKLDPRPDTSKIFKVDYYRLPDLAVDQLMSYYYDSLALYTEVERHVKSTKNDKAALEAFASKTAEKGNANYGVVFESTGKLAIANLVEVGGPVCRSGGTDCPPDQVDGFQVRANTGSSWSTRKAGPKPDLDKVVPLKNTPFMDTVMSGSPDQVRMEQYRKRYANILLLIKRLGAEQKELTAAINAAASRDDLLTI